MATLYMLKVTEIPSFHIHPILGNEDVKRSININMVW